MGSSEVSGDGPIFRWFQNTSKVYFRFFLSTSTFIPLFSAFREQFFYYPSGSFLTNYVNQSYFMATEICMDYF